MSMLIKTLFMLPRRQLLRKSISSSPRCNSGAVICGVLLGLLLGLSSQNYEIPCEFPESSADLSQNTFAGSYIAKKPTENSEATVKLPSPRDPDHDMLQKDKHLVLVGIMTAKKFLNSRIVAAYHTWASSIPGRVLFFSSEGSEEVAPSYLPVIGLKGVTDEYPPQKKSFLMLKYMHDFYGKSYEWFLRADDDVFVKGEKLADFLHSINSSTPQFMGQAGLGKTEELGLLNLNANDNFCMGGPSIAFSASTLRKMAPHISYCLRNIYSTHEDVEIGRCVRRFAKVPCTWNYEMQSIFHHNHKEPNGSYTQALKTRDIEKAVTLHPFKDHLYQYRMAAHTQLRKSQKLRQLALLYQRHVNAIDELLQDRDAFFSPDRAGLPPGLMHFIPREIDEVLTWDFFAKSQYSHRSTNPRPGLTGPIRAANDEIIRQLMSMINTNEVQRGRIIDYKDILYGYKRVDPLHGAQYVIDMLLVYKKYRGKKMTIPVRRHAYIQQPFSTMEFMEDHVTDLMFASPANVVRHQSGNGEKKNLLNIIQNYVPFTKSPGELDRHGRVRRGIPMHQKRLIFIMPLAGRYEIFLKFMSNFEVVALQMEKHVELFIMLFRSSNPADDRIPEMITSLASFQERYPQHTLQMIQMEGSFSRGLALEHGSNLHTPNALLVFMDVDMRLSRNTLNRIKLNTIQGEQVYFPIVFSQFDPDTYCNDSACRQSLSNPFRFGADVGYWRQFGFGIAAMYNSDFQAIGGFDKSIKGWGMEDVKLYETFISSSYKVFRAPDPGLVHIFHAIHCDPSIEASQYQGCLGTKSQTYASVYRLADTIYTLPTVFNRGET